MPDRTFAPRAALWTVLGVAALVALVGWLPFLTRTREVVVSTPGPAPVATPTPIALPTGKMTCVKDVTLTPAVRSLRIAIQGPGTAPAGPLNAVLIDGDTLDVVGRGTVGSFTPPTPLDIQVRQRISRPVVGYVCFVNRGRALHAIGSNEILVRTRSQTTVDNTTVVGSMTLTVLGAPKPLGSRLGAVLRSAAGFWPVAPGFAGVLALLLILGMPAGLGFALMRALRTGLEDAPERQPHGNPGNRQQS